MMKRQKTKNKTQRQGLYINNVGKMQDTFIIAIWKNWVHVWNKRNFHRFYSVI